MKRAMSWALGLMLGYTTICGATGASPLKRTHVVVHGEDGWFMGWPANNGVWCWGDEILIGFTRGDYVEQAFHNIGDKPLAHLARSMDGGQTWRLETPVNYQVPGRRGEPLIDPIDFSDENLAIRVSAAGYRANSASRGQFWASGDRGKSWVGPFSFNKLDDAPELAGMMITSRTDYIAIDRDHCLFFMSARKAGTGSPNDRVFVAQTKDGGRTFAFVAWIVPPSNPDRAVMPSTVRLENGTLVTTIRRREWRPNRNWIDCYVSSDLGRTWTHRSEVAAIGGVNGNPPALTRMRNGRLVCVFGQRDERVILARTSDDQGHTWSEAIVLRDDFVSNRRSADFGYPRMVQRADGHLVTFYYWATDERPNQHIAATIWVPPPLAQENAVR